MKADIKIRSHWLMGYGLPRAMLTLFARRDDPFAQLLIDSSRPEIARDVLRDSRFRTAKLRDRSLFRVIQRILSKTNPGVLNALEPPSLLVADPPEQHGYDG